MYRGLLLVFWAALQRAKRKHNLFAFNYTIGIETSHISSPEIGPIASYRWRRTRETCYCTEEASCTG